MIAAIFDIDGTLCDNRMGPGIIKYEKLHGKRSAQLTHFWDVLPKYILNKIHLTSGPYYRAAAANALSSFLEGQNMQASAAVFDWVAREYLLPSKRMEVVRRLNQHLEKGDMTMIVSGAFRPVVEILARELGISDFIGTQLEVQEKLYTGFILPPHNSGSVKVNQTLAYVSSKGVDVDWASSYAYSDSLLDEPLFHLVGHPVAVHPERKLKRKAKKENWEIIASENT